MTKFICITASVNPVALKLNEEEESRQTETEGVW